MVDRFDEVVGAGRGEVRPERSRAFGGRASPRELGGVDSERTREGLAKARAFGRKLGRPKGSLGVSRLDGKEDEMSVTGARPTPTLAAELGPTATPTTAGAKCAFPRAPPRRVCVGVLVIFACG